MRQDIFGGQVAGQALRAAAYTVEPGYFPNSVHCYFLRRGKGAEPVTIAVDRVRDGRTYVSRQVQVSQGGKTIFSMMASFHVDEPGREFDHPMPGGLGDPDDLPFEDPMPWESAIEQRHVVVAPPSMRWWGRSSAPVSEDPILHYCGLLYASDMGAGGVAMAAVGFGDGLGPHRDADGRPIGNFGSLDHALWFHRRPAVDEWFLCDAQPLTVRDSRGLVTGTLFDRAGNHLASFTQEMFLKESDPSPHVLPMDLGR
jgi:acyl-CoA thioesterase-2